MSGSTFPWSETIKPLLDKGFIVCGAGGSRTRVQTYAR
jgi:hypothetical protein